MYFNKFPNINYQFPDNIVRNFNNISLRAAVVDNLLNDYSNLQMYAIKEGETPEDIAFNIYGNAYYHWIILLSNNILNIYNDWPKTTQQLNDYLYEKYKTQEDSDGNVVILSRSETNEFLEFVGTTTNGFESYIDGTTVKIKPHHFVDAWGVEYSYDTKDYTVNAYGRTNYMPELFPVSHCNYEFALNEKKRSIVIPTRTVALKMEKELAKLLNE